MSTTSVNVTSLNVTMATTTSSMTQPTNFIGVLAIMLVLGVMFGTTIVVIILVSLWPRRNRKRKRRRRSSIGGADDIPMRDLDSVYAELDNKSVSTTMTRITSEYSIDSETELGAYTNPICEVPNGVAGHGGGGATGGAGDTRTNTSKKVRFSDHQVEIPGEPNGVPRNKLYIDVR